MDATTVWVAANEADEADLSGPVISTTSSQTRSESEALLVDSCFLRPILFIVPKDDHDRSMLISGADKGAAGQGRCQGPQAARGPPLQDQGCGHRLRL